MRLRVVTIPVWLAVVLPSGHAYPHLQGAVFEETVLAVVEERIPGQDDWLSDFRIRVGM